jgi:hypothetical protein
MDIAKISGVAAYHKCIKDLHQFGYIQYVPSYNPAICNRGFLLKVGDGSNVVDKTDFLSFR